MTSLIPREPYTSEEIRRLYPARLELQLVQVILRHGERVPTSVRFKNAGLSEFWPYCSIAQKMISPTLRFQPKESWENLAWRRHIETFSEKSDAPTWAAGKDGEIEGLCNLGELTDPGRRSTLALGQRLRNLYVDQLHFMPESIPHTKMFYMRTTYMARALESLQQAFEGMYPPAKRADDFPPPLILSRTWTKEILMPNTGACKRMGELYQKFTERAGERWDDTPEMAHIQSKIGKWMPPTSAPISVTKSKPVISGIMDTINSTRAHSAATRLPSEFYDPKVLTEIERIGTEAWFAGIQESEEYRRLGIGAAMAGFVARMVASARGDRGEGGVNVKFGLTGAHDTSLASILGSVGAFDYKDGKWPPYTSHVAIELFKDKTVDHGPIEEAKAAKHSILTTFSSMFSSKTQPNPSEPPLSHPQDRAPLAEQPTSTKQKLKNHYVRIRYNDEPVKVPGCAKQGDHLEGDDSFCTLEAFKKIVDKFTPKHWEKECLENLGKSAFPEKIEQAGYY